MISYQAIMQQLEKQLVSVKHTSNEQQIREAFIAIRALCDVVLDGQGETQPKSQHIPQMLVSEPVTFNTVKVTEEDGANGDSIFDF
ncbi:YwdI family protein [Lysinibacillus piscis]|uniref:Uracil-DNA glycosylase n=1 Tax=Lysinibacillus piscis TaxID=2518931 RepID=A0ABQ5NI04_9BACI|nr:YwdI family protein [Lysinibacillus sp. KH24]GLC87988.1 hypothetical protein LYSBPC_11150 [Lysinibacillus sp. KH24]